MTSLGNGILPVGSIITWALEINPDDNYLECNGQVVDGNKYPKLYALMHNTPDNAIIVRAEKRQKVILSLF